MDEFSQEQKIVCTILKNAVKNNKCSHAYLLETNGYEKKDKFVLEFVKYLLCPHHQQNECKECNQCEQIDKGIFSELKIIEPDGMWIKKEQLEELQKEFSTTSIQSNYRIYIIKNAEKLNTSAANSILKFLEEPELNIIAILMTDNLYQMLDTIISRCQIISFSKNNSLKGKELLQKLNLIISNTSEEDIQKSLEEKVVSALSFVDYYENNGLDTILKLQKLWHNQFKERDMIILGFDLMILYYKDVINYKLERELEIFNEMEEQISKIASKNTIDQLCKKLKIIVDLKEENKINVNISLLMDKLIIKLEEVK